MDLKRARLCIQSRFPNAPLSANRWRVLLARRNIRNQTRFRSVRTCMSIARRTEKNPKVRRTLISIEKHAGPLPKVR